MVAASAFFIATRTTAPPPATPVTVAALPAAVPEQPPQPAPEAAPALPPKVTAKAKPSKKFHPAAVRQATKPVASAVDLPDVEVASDVTPGAPIVDAGSAALPPRQPETVTLSAGTLLQVRLGERLASDRNVVGDTFFATLDQPLVVNGFVIADRGARVLGRIADVDQAGRVEGVARLSLELASLTTADGQKIELRTARFIRKGDTSRKSDAVKIGVGTAIGAAIGAAVGGGKGAAIGAASGGAAGTGAVLATRGKAAVLDTETRLSFRLDSPVTVTERF